MYEIKKCISFSKSKLQALNEDMKSSFGNGCQLKNKLCVYVCGSLGRLEMSKESDLDLFFIIMSDNKEMERFCTKLTTYQFFAQMKQINDKHKFKSPSKGGYYWEFLSKDLLMDIGSREEDYNNSFTARMLLLLESKPIYNGEAYDSLLNETVDKYFAEYKDHSYDFLPLYLMNDILRYWYTLTLNYEYRRDGKDSKNEKIWKRLKLKFARLLTCFSMLACLFKSNICKEDVISFVNMTPFERLDFLVEENKDIKELIDKIKSEYLWFLDLKEKSEEIWDNEDFVRDAFKHADTFHNLVVHKLLSIISSNNQSLREKMDIIY